MLWHSPITCPPDRVSLPDSFEATMHRTACRVAWHPQGPHRSTLPPRATTFQGIPPYTRRRRGAWRSEAGPSEM